MQDLNCHPGSTAIEMQSQQEQDSQLRLLLSYLEQCLLGSGKFLYGTVSRNDDRDEPMEQ
jgi:hypothetical protein